VGAADIAELLIKSGANVNQAKKDNGWTPLMCAASNKHLKTAELLIKNGADVNQAKTDGGWTALMAACDEGAADIAELLIESGANVNQATKDGLTALMYVAQEGHLDVARLLLNHGANPAAKTVKSNKNALDLARDKGKRDIVGVLAYHLLGSMYNELTGDPLTLGAKVVTDYLLNNRAVTGEMTSDKSYKAGILNYIVLNGLSLDKNEKHNGMIIVKELSGVHGYSNFKIGTQNCSLEKYLKSFGYSLFIDSGTDMIKFKIRKFLRGNSGNTLSIIPEYRLDGIDKEESSLLFPVVLDAGNSVNIMQIS
jgi:hypothetical protein